MNKNCALVQWSNIKSKNFFLPLLNFILQFINKKKKIKES
jgi:hypothetical protein